MFFTDYSNQRTKKGELLDKYTPLQKVDFANPPRRCADDLATADKLGFAFRFIAMSVAVATAVTVMVEIYYMVAL